MTPKEQILSYEDCISLLHKEIQPLIKNKKFKEWCITNELSYRSIMTILNTNNPNKSPGVLIATLSKFGYIIKHNEYYLVINSNDKS